ncbi:MAG: hypothetical protein AAF664_22910 [Planctomycetota bacterium]
MNRCRLSGHQVWIRPDRPLEITNRFWSRFPFFLLAITPLGCDTHPPKRALESLTTSVPELESEDPRTLPADSIKASGLYSSLTGKMARMEELLNAIDRFLDIPDFHDRVVADAQEFELLLTESRGLYPETLVEEDQPGFDKAIDETAITAEKLLSSIKANDAQAARDALRVLDKFRLRAHTRFSY